MQLTDEEIRQIIIREKKRKRRRARIIKRVAVLVIFVLILVIGIGVFINRNAVASPRGIIFIDPGHGGIDSGSCAGKRYEKNDTLKISKLVKKDLEDLGFKVYMSRTEDVDVDRAERGVMANDKKARLFVSIHRNKATEGEGVEIYISSENDRESNLLAANIIKALASNGFTNRGITSGTLVSSSEDYYENSIPEMPSCLIELGFIQNSADNKLFDEKLELNADAIAKAIEKTYKELYEPKEIE